MDFSVGTVWPSGFCSYVAAVQLTDTPGRSVGGVITILSVKCSFLGGCSGTCLSELSWPVKMFSE